MKKVKKFLCKIGIHHWDEIPGPGAYCLRFKCLWCGKQDHLEEYLEHEIK